MGILQVASYIYKRYMDDFGVRIDEMKLQIWVKFRIKEEGVAYDTPSFTVVLVCLTIIISFNQRQDTFLL